MKVLISTGGTGGHIFPAIETAKALKLRGHQVSFAGVLGANEDKIRQLDFPAFSLSAHGLTDDSLRGKLAFSRTMSQAILCAFGIVRHCAPDKIIGFGGYAAFPVVMAGFLMRRPVMIHEQNVVPGRANTVLAKMARRVAISFDASRRYLDRRKVVWTGCPCRHKNAGPKPEAMRFFGLDAKRKTILVTGGSQGSQKLNEVFFGAMPELSAAGLQAIHMTGPKEFALYERKYGALGLPVKVRAFISEMDQAYAAADVIVSRAGAATITELGLLGLPAVLVPYPFAGNHQKYNAQVLADKGVAIIIEQKDLTKASLKEAVTRLLLADLSREEILKKTKGLFQEDAALQLALVAEGL